MQKTIATAAIFLASLYLGAASAQSFQEGVHFVPVEPVQPTDDPGRVEVVEVFSYACPACATFEPHIQPWADEQPEHVQFKRLPVVFRAQWEPFARAYYTAEAMGILDQAHPVLFDALYEQRAQVRSIEDIAQLLADQAGIDAEEYLKTARSFAVDTRLRRGTAQAQRYGVDSTPTVIVNGKYRVTGKMAGSLPQFIEVIDYLVAREAEALSESPAESAPSAETSE